MSRNLLPHNKVPYLEIVDKFSKGAKSILYCSGTGTGKSYVTKELLNTTFDGKKILYVVPTLNIAKYLANIARFSEYGDRLQFCTYRMFCNFNKSIAFIKSFDVVILDEVHHVGSDISGQNITEMMSMVKAKFLGLTATPVREDGTNVSKFFEHKVQGLTHFEAIDKGLMPKFDYLVCSPKLNSLTAEQRKRVKISMTNSKEFLKSIVNVKPKNKWLAFFSSVEQLEEHVPLVTELFPDYKIYKLYSTMDEDPDATLQALNTEDKVIIMSCDMLLEGYHVDTVDGVLLFRNVQSLTVFQQILGRVSSIGSNTSPLIVDCTESAYKLLTKLLNQDKSRSPRDKYERSDFPNQEHAILNVSLEYAQAYDIMFLLKNIKNRSNKQPQPIIVNGTAYVDKESCCVELGLNYREVCAKMRNQHLSFEDAVNSVMLGEVDHFIVKGVDYKTQKIFCETTGASNSYINKHVKSDDLTREEAASLWLDTVAFHYKGNYYKSRAACCRKLNISDKAVSTYKSKHDVSDADAITAVAASNSEQRLICGFVYNSKLYASFKDCCDALGIDYSEVIRLKNTGKYSSNEAIDYLVDNGNVVLPDDVDVFVLGNKSCKSYNNCCEVLHLPKYTLTRYQVKYGDSRQESIKRYLSKHADKYQSILATL